MADTEAAKREALADLAATNPREMLVVNVAGYGHMYGPDPTGWPDFAIADANRWLAAALAAPAVEPRSSGEREAEYWKLRQAAVVAASIVGPRRLNVWDGTDAESAIAALDAFVLPLLRQREPSRDDLLHMFHSGWQSGEDYALNGMVGVDADEEFEKALAKVTPAGEPDAPTHNCTSTGEAMELQWVCERCGYRAALSREKP